MSSRNERRSGVSINTVVQIVFIILKLVDVIDWSWWVVLIPTWIDLGFLAIVLIYTIADHIFKNLFSNPL